MEDSQCTQYHISKKYNPNPHPAGDEVVLCLTGEMTLHQEFADGRSEAVTIGAGEYAINAPGVWHTADVAGQATALFITAGLGTQHRPR